MDFMVIFYIFFAIHLTGTVGVQPGIEPYHVFYILHIYSNTCTVLVFLQPWSIFISVLGWARNSIPSKQKMPCAGAWHNRPAGFGQILATEEAVPCCSCCPYRKAVLSGRCPAVPAETSLDASHHVDRVSLFRTKKQAHETSHEPVLRGSDRIRTYDTPGMNRML